MPTATKEIKCTSCGDDISIGAKITIKDSTRIGAKRSKDFLCFRCNPETASARIRVRIPLFSKPQQELKFNLNKQDGITIRPIL